MAKSKDEKKDAVEQDREEICGDNPDKNDIPDVQEGILGPVNVRFQAMEGRLLECERLVGRFQNEFAAMGRRIE